MDFAVIAQVGGRLSELSVLRGQCLRMSRHLRVITPETVVQTATTAKIA